MRNQFAIPIFLFIIIFSSCNTVSIAEPLTPAPNPPVPYNIIFCGKTVNFDRNDMYERFDRELTSLVYGHGNTLLMLKRANKYFPRLANILQQEDMPLDFLYLASIESTLNQRALSPAGAAGLWQFIPATAKQYGLEVTEEVDERYNLEKATVAASKYFKDAFKKYRDWPSVMASFNCGMGRISNELRDQDQSSSFDLYLNEETSRYVFRIMALAQIFKDPAAYGFQISPEQFYQPVECEIVEVSGSIDDWTKWANDHGISYAQLREENPWIRTKKLTNKDNKTYEVRVPKKESLYRSSNPVQLYNSDWNVKD